MEKWTQIAAIVGVCIAGLLIGVVKRNTRLFFHFVERMIIGTAAIIFCNEILLKLEIANQIGLNPFTVLACGFLGMPGVVGLYGLHYYLLF